MHDDIADLVGGVVRCPVCDVRRGGMHNIDDTYIRVENAVTHRPYCLGSSREAKSGQCQYYTITGDTAEFPWRKANV